MAFSYVLTFLGGIALFIYGIILVSESFERAAFGSFSRFLKSVTSKPILGVILGTFITGIIQSSSATTVAVVSLANAGILRFQETLGIIFGANIGTTVTAQIIAFKITNMGLPTFAVGFLIYFFSKRESLKMLGKGILAFGLIFIGMTFMEGAVAPLKNSETFKQLFLKFGQVPILGILVSALFTGIEQSSSVTVGIIQALASQNLINLRTAFALVLGANIGTTITAIIASIGGNTSARRVALAHVMFNVGGVLIFLPFFNPYVSVASHTSISLVRQIANSHSIFNIICTFIYLPFYKPYARLVEKMVPGDEKVIEGGARYINAKLLKVPTVAVEAIKNELYRLKDTVKSNFKCLFDMIVKNDGKLVKEIQFRERAINDITKEIQTFISKVFGSLVSEKEAEKVTSYLNISIQLERVGDIVNGTSELMIEKIGNGIIFSEYAQEDLKNMVNTVNKEFEITTENLEAIDEEKFLIVDNMERTVDELEVELRDKHIKRLTEGVCTTEAGLIYIDILSNLERMSDHIYKIARLLKPAEEKNNLI